MNSEIIIDSKHIKEILRILSSIFPGVLIYYSGLKAHQATAEGKKPEIDILLDLGRKIGEKDIAEAQKELATTHIPYTIYLYDLTAVSERERKEFLKKAICWNCTTFEL